MDTHANYLREIGFNLRGRALEARDQARATRHAHDEGYAQAYAHVINHMQNQAEVFGLPLSELALDGIDPYEDLAM